MLSDLITSYYIHKLICEKKYSNDDIERIQYSFASILSELEKAIVLLIFFTMLQSVDLFLVSFICLVPVRIWSGGLHFSSNKVCLFFTIAFFYVAVEIMPKFCISKQAIWLLSAFAVIVYLIFSPIINEDRREMVSGKDMHKKVMATSLIIFFIALSVPYIVDKKFKVIFCTVVLQSVQLLIAALCLERRCSREIKGI